MLALMAPKISVTAVIYLKSHIHVKNPLFGNRSVTQMHLLSFGIIYGKEKKFVLPCDWGLSVQNSEPNQHPMTALQIPEKKA